MKKNYYRKYWKKSKVTNDKEKNQLIYNSN